MREAGFTGVREDLSLGLLHGFEETSAYNSDPRRVQDNEIMAEDEYFKVLAKAMNNL